MDTMPSVAHVSRETGRTRTARYIVWSLDVWGHSSADCAEYDCPCASVDEDGAAEHDDDACECRYEVNDRCRVGTLDVPETETEHNVGTPYAFTSWSSTDDAIRDALVEAGYVKAEMRERIGFDDVGDEQDIYIQDEKDGRPEFQLERDTSDEAEET
jgi:hypothetical protein